MDSLSFKDKIYSFPPNFLLFDQTSLLSCKSDRDDPIYSDVNVGQARCEPPGSVGFRDSSTAEYQAWASSVRKKIVYMDPLCHDAFKSQTNFLLECYSDSGTALARALGCACCP